MNDAHDNAADDRAMWQRARTMAAVEAFRKQELKRLQLEMAEYALTKELDGRLDLDSYHEQTEQIRHQMELKRADYARLGKLPKDNALSPAETAAHLIGTLGPEAAERRLDPELGAPDSDRPEDYWRDARRPG